MELLQLRMSKGKTIGIRRIASRKVVGFTTEPFKNDAGEGTWQHTPGKDLTLEKDGN